MACSLLVGRIRELRTERAFTLEAYTPVGRAAHGGLLLKDERVSNEHACLKWKSGQGWVVRDLGSTNGTWVNGELLPPRGDRPLVVGDRLAFGASDELWAFEDGSAPEPMASPVGGGESCTIADGVIAIPSPENALGTIFQGTDGSWVFETTNATMPLTSGTIFDVAGRLWRFSCPSEWFATTKSQQLRLVQDSTLIFEVSNDEEHVTLNVTHQGERIPMGHLSAFYFLLTLARIRVREREHLTERESGWVHREDLMTMLRCGEQQLNVWVHRIRARFSSKGFLDYASIIERRDGSGQLRIGVDRIVLPPQR